MVTIIPAIDLKDGHCVRLRQGKADDVTVYSDDPVMMARRWAEEGATYLHVVDLDGAFQGRPAHTEVIENITQAIDIPVEVGGGIRTDEDIRRLLACGVDRAIVGTRAFAEPEALERLADEFGSRLAVGIDAKDGYAQIKGWVERTDVKAEHLAERAANAGVRTLIYTDTAKDGMMSGVNIDAMKAMCDAVACDVIASGGITRAEDVRRLRALDCPNLVGAIVGKALYEGAVSLRELENGAD